MLYLIPTPIGNREDITLRALRLFKELKIFVCEDTRTFKKLLSMYEIDYTNKQFYSLTSFTKGYELEKYLHLLQFDDIGVVSEAGTPGLSDPGKVLIKLCGKYALPYCILPGANALVPAVVGSVFDTSKFTYLGFLPQKKGRQTALKNILKSDIPVFFYESVHRVEKLVSELEVLGFQGEISVARELTKIYEQLFTGGLDVLKKMIIEKKLPIKGEFVIGIKN